MLAAPVVESAKAASQGSSSGLLRPAEPQTTSASDNRSRPSRRRRAMVGEAAWVPSPLSTGETEPGTVAYWIENAALLRTASYVAVEPALRTQTWIV